MTLEEFKTGFLNRSICIYAPRNEAVDAIKNAMVSSMSIETMMVQVHLSVIKRNHLNGTKKLFIQMVKV